jgi:hypothetical protein
MCAARLAGERENEHSKGEDQDTFARDLLYVNLNTWIISSAFFLAFSNTEVSRRLSRRLLEQQLYNRLIPAPCGLR